MKKTLAEIAYDTYSATFNIGVQGNHKGGKVEVGPAPYRKLPPVDQARWHAVANRLKLALVPSVGPVVIHLDRPIRCKCGARFMNGESHVCNDDPQLIARLSGKAS